MSVTLTEFLLARIAEDEAAAQYEYVLNADPAHFPIYYEGRAFWPGRGEGLPMGREEYENLLRAAFDVRTEVTDARVLAECEAKRQIVGEHKHIAVVYDDGSGQGRGCVICDQDRDYGTLSGTAPGGWCPTVRYLALPYADHPDYREEWKL